MAHIVPFKGIRYSQAKVEMKHVVAPPYDIISPEQQNRLYDESPYNVVRLILGREEDRYTSAAGYYSKWRDEKILFQDPEPTLYLLAQTFTDQDGSKIVRKGFIGACELVEIDKKIVLPHEKTLSKPKADRLNLMKATMANFSQIFGLYADPDQALGKIIDKTMQYEPHIDVTFEAVRNRLWIITGNEDIAYIRQHMKDKQILIADGHHRYETALAYREIRKSQNPAHAGTEPYNYVMMFFTNMYDEGLVIYPTHRVLHSMKDFERDRLIADLKRFYSVEEVSGPERLKASLNSKKRYAFGLVVAGTQYLVYLNNTSDVEHILPAGMPAEVKALDVTILHTHIFGSLLHISVEAQEQKLYLDYIKDFDETIRAVEAGNVQAGFLMNPTPIEQVQNVARAGYTMPQKSTYFYPKLISGLVINPLE
jgi:uncharacterized protein (DUF1015 family)